jgi:small-conductance mechanosensitive channel
METELLRIWLSLQDIWGSARMQADLLLLPSRRLQLLVIAVCFLAAWALRRLAVPRMRAWLHKRQGWPRWRLRVMVVVQKRLQLIFLVALLWTATGLMRLIFFFPSRSYLVELAATIASAWLAISLAARLIRNVTLRRFVMWALGIWVTLYYVGLGDETTAFLDRVAIEAGQFRMSLLTVIEALVVTGVLFMLARFVSRVGADRIRGNKGLSASVQVLSVKLMQIALYTAAVLIGLTAVGVDLTAFAFMSGAIGLGLGFGLQKVVSNLVSGLIILLDKSIKPGDVISLGETFGWISSLGARYVGVVTRDGKEYLIPNEDLITGQVVNWSHSNRFVRLDIYFGTAYGDDPHLVRKVAVEAAAGVKRVLSSRSPVCHIVGFGDSSVDYILRFWIDDPTGGLTNIRGNVYLALWDAFRANGITIPFPQREVKVLEGSSVQTVQTTLRDAAE